MLIKQNQLVINGTTLEQSDLQAIANVASDVQAQIDTKAPINNAQFTGNVGIGTNAPAAKLTIAEDLTGPLDATAFRLNASSANDSNTLFGGPVSSGNYSFFQSYKEGTSAGVRALAINPAGGNVGIGATSPASRLHIKAGSSGYDGGIQIEDTDSTTKSAITHVNGTLYISSNTTADHISILANGNVGIGDGNPTSLLSISKNSTRTTDFENMLKITHTSSGTTGVGFGSAIYFVGERENGANQAMGRLLFDAEVNSGTNISSGFSVQTATAGSTSEKFRITHDGNVGIGITGPNSVSGYRTLHIRGTTGSLIDMGASGTDSRIVGDTNGLGFEVSTGSHSNQNIRWKAGTISGALDSHMLLNSSGNLGINKTAPSAKLHVVDSVSDTISAANAVVKIDGTGGDGLSFGNTQSSPYSSWMQAGYLNDSFSPAFNNGYPILINPIGGNVMIGSNVPNSYLHIDKRTTDNTTGKSQFQIRADGSGARAERIKRITYCYRPLYNQYTFHRIKLGGGVYGAGQTIRYRVTFTTGHASGHGFVEGVISLYAHHSTSKMHLTGHTKYLRHYSNGSYYGWTSNPDVDFFFSNNTDSNACVIMRVQGHGNHNGGTFDLTCDHHIDLEIHGSDHTTNTECTQIGHSAPGDMGTVFSSSTLS